jgi:hypothetical protein
MVRRQARSERTEKQREKPAFGHLQVEIQFPPVGSTESLKFDEITEANLAS